MHEVHQVLRQVHWVHRVLRRVHWVHRLLAYSLAILVIVRAVRAPGPRATGVLLLVLLQVIVGAATVLLGLPPTLQATHVAVGAAVWAGAVLAGAGADEKRPA